MKKFSTMIIMIILSISLVGCGKTDDSENNHKEIQAYTRDTSSGTREAFFDIIGIKKDFAETTVGKIQEVSSNGDMISKVENDKNGIGYISLSSYDPKKLKALTYGGVIGSDQTVLNGEYGLKRPFNYIVRENVESDEDQIIAALIAFMTTEEGKATIYANGGIVEMKDTDVSWNDIKQNYPITTKDNSHITVKFGGSTSVQKIAEALSGQFKGLAGNFIADHNHTGSSDAYKRTQGSEKDGANKIHMGFLSRDFNLSEESKKENTYGILAWDAVVVVVHKNNAITDIDAQTLKAIYTGEKKEW